jgi:hypothetical protein
MFLSPTNLARSVLLWALLVTLLILANTDVWLSLPPVCLILGALPSWLHLEMHGSRRLWWDARTFCLGIFMGLWLPLTVTPLYFFVVLALTAGYSYHEGAALAMLLVNSLALAVWVVLTPLLLARFSRRFRLLDSVNVLAAVAALRERPREFFQLYARTALLGAVLSPVAYWYSGLSNPSLSELVCGALVLSVATMSTIQAFARVQALDLDETESPPDGPGFNRA